MKSYYAFEFGAGKLDLESGPRGPRRLGTLLKFRSVHGRKAWVEQGWPYWRRTAVTVRDMPKGWTPRRAVSVAEYNARKEQV